ncbi:MAG: succinate dehydrogenase, cytochrome b556 subunit [Pseudohongiella sp.]|nr:succinate dehydrogenase, cytochrome b556 subunit [Pseudohongiella sp.]
MKDNRPINLDFKTLRLPLPAITSILHRISGVIIFGGVFVLLWLLSSSLKSEAGFLDVQAWLAMPLVKFVVWAILAGLLYHLIAGVKHLVMDLGIGETLEGANTGAKLVVVVSVIAMLLAGVWLW